MRLKDPPHIDLRHLRYFTAASENGSFRKTAEMLGPQGSTISRAVRDLEDRLGASLFQRRSHGVQLTIAGERFLNFVTTALRQIDEGAKSVAAVGRADIGQVRIGILSSIASGFLSNLLNEFEKNYPEIGMTLVDGVASEHVSAIDRLQIDVAFITNGVDPRDFETVELWRERVFAALPQGHILENRSEVKWSELGGERFIASDRTCGPDVQDCLERRFLKGGMYPAIQRHSVSRENWRSLVARGSGIMLTSEATTMARLPGIVYRPISGEALQFNAIWSHRNDNPALRRLLSLARSMSDSAAS